MNLIRRVVDENCGIDQQLLSHANWSEVMAFCLLQGVAGICYDVLEKMEEACRPSGDPLITWFGQVYLHENLFIQHKVALRHLAKFYEQEGIKMMLLKGYGLSLFWPKPEHRPMGDIDCYNFGQQQLADKRIRENFGIEIDNSHHKHTVFQFKGAIVENHY